MKRKILVGLFVVALLLNGCGPLVDTEDIGSSQPTQMDGTEDIENTMSSEFEEQENEMLDLNKYSLENDASEYPQTSYPWNNLSKGDAGYYYAGKSMMRLLSPEAESLIAVCNKPNCKHEDNSCVANGYAFTLSEWLFMPKQSYYKGYIYFVGQNAETGYVSLYRMAEDGSSREEYMHLFKYDTSASSFRSPYFLLNGDCIYYVDNGEEQRCIRKCELGKETQTVIFSTGRTDGNIYRLKIYGDFLFFQAGIMDEKGNATSGIYAYNMRNGETKLVLNSAIACYSVVGNELIYADGGDICSYDLLTGERVTLIDTDSGGDFRNNNEYIVLENLEVYSLSGEYVCTLAIEDFDDILGMDEDYIIASGPGRKSDDEESVEKLLLKSVAELDDKPFAEYVCED